MALVKPNFGWEEGIRMGLTETGVRQWTEVGGDSTVGLCSTRLLISGCMKVPERSIWDLW